MRSTYLTKRRDRFHVRLRVPSDLVCLFGRVELHRSLRTNDGRLARRLARSLRATAEEAFATLRHQRARGASAEELQDATRALYTRDLPVTRTAVVTRNAYGASSNSAPQRAERLSEAIDAYIADRTPSWAAKTLLMHSLALRFLVQIVGDKLLRAVTRQDCRTYRDTIAKLPPNMTKRFKGLTLAQVIERNEPPMNAKTVNKNLAVVVALFNWCNREGLVSENPARGLTLKLSRRADSERDAFKDDDLKAIFAGLTPAMGARYWLPLVALYSGMRLEEIAQLHSRDVRQENGVWVFDVNASNGKKLKNEQSRRLVPIHNRLLSAGIVEHCREASKVGDARLWPTLQRGSDGFYSSPFSQWFGRYKIRVGITSSKLTFHSFRHTAINQLKQRGASELAIKELVGHANASITTARYGKRFEPNVMRDVVNNLVFPV